MALLNLNYQLTLFFIVYSLFKNVVTGLETLSVMSDYPESSKKTFSVNANSLHAEHESDSFVDGDLLQRIRRDIKGRQPTHNFYHFNDAHYVAEVHWSGSNSSVILMLMRDPKPQASSPSHFYVSRDYGKTFKNVTYKLTTPNGSIAVINDYYPSPIDNRRYILTAKFQKFIFISSDECRTFSRVPVRFTPTKMVYHKTYTRYILGYDEDHPRNQLYVSTNYGFSWKLKGEYVRSFYWGVKPYDYASIMYLERRLPGKNTSQILKTYSWGWYTRVVVQGVKDFKLVEQYMFATKSQANMTDGETDLLVSNRRKYFRVAQFPLNLKKQSFVVGDASENQVFVAVNHGNDITNLYISDVSGISFTLSLEQIVYYHKREQSFLRRFVNHSFIDLYRVQSIYGIYIANMRVKGRGRTQSRTVISFDKGGEWNVIGAPKVDSSGRQTLCVKDKNCSLHLSQEYGYHNPYTRFQPIFSRKSAPGLILATGSLGKQLTSTSPNVYMSADAGLTWKEALKGHWFYRFADHGGVLVALPRYGLADTLKYSWNDGINWLTYKFSGVKIRVYGLLSEPGEKSTVFTVFGSYTAKHSWLIVQVNMSSVLGFPCQSSDYKNWTVSDGRSGGERCMLGKKQTFEKRDPKSQCFNGYNYDRPVASYNCQCRREDFECDFGFMPRWRGWIERVCVDDPNDKVDPLKTPDHCTPGTFYNRTRGYRKVSGDTCTGGQENVYAPVLTACPVQEVRDFLLFAARRNIRRISLSDNSADVTFRISGLVNAIAVDYDYKNKYLYWGDITTDKIQRRKLYGSGNIETVVALNESRSHIEAVAFDWMGNNIYWCDPGMKQIGVVQVTNYFHRKVLVTERLVRPRALAIDPQHGYMYWTDWGRNPKIEKAQMDGQGRKSIVTTDLYWPNGITIDHDHQRLFWCDAGQDRIETSDFNGRNRKTVLSRGVPHPYAITWYKKSLYWDDWSSASIETAALDGTSRKRLRHLPSLMDLKAFWPAKQQGTNGCSRKPCKFLCLATPSGFSCACPDNLITTKSSTGEVICNCPNGEKLGVDGKCLASNHTCKENQFRCANGFCMPKTWRCDHDNDCGDNSDEIGCSYVSCGSTQYECKSHRCIPRRWLCDGDKDCGGGEDESHCNKTCAPGQFKCNNTRCISKRWLCDGDNDCYDNSDEQGCTTPATRTTRRGTTVVSSCPSTRFRCNNGNCIPKDWFCNGAFDCTDGSDEPSNCSLHCNARQIKCVSERKCISRFFQCDGSNDCRDGSDEKDCPTTPTRATPTQCGFRCASGQCVDFIDRCNGKKDCMDNSDEKGCVIPTCPVGTRPCKTDLFCISVKQLCDGRFDCKDGSDEEGCVTTRPSSPCKPFPFGFNCTSGELCLPASSYCNGQTECGDLSDDNSTLCAQMTKMENLKVVPLSANEVKLSWKRTVLGVNVNGFYIEYKPAEGFEQSVVIQPSIAVGNNTYRLSGLNACTSYEVAISPSYDNIPKSKWIFRTASFTTEVDEDPKKPTNIAFIQTSNTAGTLHWTNADFSCLAQERTVVCSQISPKLSDHDFLKNADSASVHLSDLVKGGVYNCTVTAAFHSLQTGKAFKLANNYKFKLTVTEKFRGKNQPKNQTLVWAIPVALVVLILLIALVVVIFKYRNLQQSFLAFANRGYARASEEEEDMAVAFHSGEDAPMINRFSDDEPLVVA